MTRTKISRSAVLILILFLTGCSPEASPPRSKATPHKSYTSPGKSSGASTNNAGKNTGTKPYKVLGKYYHPLASARGFSQKGIASWYGKQFHGRKTSNGEIYNMYKISAAHKTLPLGTWVRVHNLKNNKKLDIRINDRGPFVAGRIIDLSYMAAKKLGVIGPGTAPVKVVALGMPSQDSSGHKSYTPMDYWKGNFTIQVGAFTVKENALNLRKKLSVRYQNAHITTYADARGTFYRVRVGRYDNLMDAEKFCSRMNHPYSEQPFTVAE